MDDLIFIVQKTKAWKTDFSRRFFLLGFYTISDVRGWDYEELRVSVYAGLSIQNFRDNYLKGYKGNRLIKNTVDWPEDGIAFDINSLTLQYISGLIEYIENIFETTNVSANEFVDALSGRKGNVLLKNLFSELKEVPEGELTKDDFLFCTHQLGKLPKDLGSVYEICGTFNKNKSFNKASEQFDIHNHIIFPEEPTTKIKLRPYQKEAIKAMFDFFKQRHRTMGVIQLPTGTGKTIVAHEIANRFLEENKNNRVIWLAKSWELLTQTACSWSEGWGKPEWMRRIGGKKLSLGGIGNGAGGRIFFTTLHSFKSYLDKKKLPEPISCDPNILVVYDECHWAVNATIGKSVIDYFLPEEGSFSKVMGLSATPKEVNRLSGRLGYYDKSDNMNFVYQKSWAELSDYLAKPKIEFLQTGVKWEPIINKEFHTIDDRSLDELARNVIRNKKIIEHVTDGIDDQRYKKIILFAINISHANELAKLLGQRSVSAGLLHSLVVDDKNITIAKFREGQTQVLVNVEMFTHGMNVPEADTVVMARPTDSKELCAQMIGRGCRKTKNKTEFTIVEVHDTIYRYAEYIFYSRDVIGDNRVFPLSSTKGPRRVHQYPIDPQIRTLPMEMLEVSEVPFVVGQTFGVEIEITSKDENVCDSSFEENAEDIIEILKRKVDVYPEPLGYHQGREYTHQWRVENDSSCGWEIISPILKNEEGFYELKQVCHTLTDFLEDHKHLIINHGTGLHVTLATKFFDEGKLKNFIHRLQRLERGLFTLVAPSRLYDFSGEYNYEEPNKYCQPVNMVDDIDEFFTDDDIVEFFTDDISKRYYSVNFTHFPEDIELLEVRMHNGTSMYEKIIPWISLWMMIFNASRFRCEGPGFRGKVFEGNNIEISQPTAEWEDIFWLLKKEDISINNKLKEILWNRRKELSIYWEKAIPNRVKSWRDYGWFDSEETIDRP